MGQVFRQWQELVTAAETLERAVRQKTYDYVANSAVEITAEERDHVRVTLALPPYWAPFRVLFMEALARQLGKVLEATHGQVREAIAAQRMDARDELREELARCTAPEGE